MTVHLALVDIVVLAVYALGIFALAQRVSRSKRGVEKSSAEYFLASRSLPWWAIGTSLIAANISSEQIVGMAGSGYAMGLAIASWEWMASVVLLVVAKLFLPIYLKNKIYTMPQFLEYRYGVRIRTLMAVFWLGIFIFVNLTAIIWLGSIVVNQIGGIDQGYALVLLGGFALLYQLWGGLKAVALTDIVQVSLLIIGGTVISALSLQTIAAGGGMIAGFRTLAANAPDHFHMILSRDNRYYQDLPGLSALVGGMWIMQTGYWGCNQYIIQRALAAKSLREAQKGVMLAAYLKLLMPFIIVLPGIAAVVLSPGLAHPDQAYSSVLKLLPPGLLGLVFAALIAAIVASAASKINSIATIFALDVWNTRKSPRADRELVLVGRLAAVSAVLMALMAARPLLGHFDQAFQFILEYMGFFTPGIVVIFLLGLFWARATEAGALVSAVGSFGLSLAIKLAWPTLPFLDRMVFAFAAALVLAIAVSMSAPAVAGANRIDTRNVGYSTSTGFAIGAAGILIILAVFYTIWW